MFMGELWLTKQTAAESLTGIWHVNNAVIFKPLEIPIGD